MKLSGLTITRNVLSGGFPFVESILALLPLCEEYIVMDDSTDGTTEVLERLRKRYGKLKIIREPWPLQAQRDKALATVTNWGIEACQGEWVVYAQADEVFGEWVTPHLPAYFLQSKYDTVTFHRMQLFQNFQIQHGDHWVVRMGRKEALHSADDALSFHVKPGSLTHVYNRDPDDYQLFDITRCFVDHFPAKYAGQDEIWHHQAGQQGGWHGRNRADWVRLLETWQREGYPAEWTTPESPYKHLLPASMQGWVGATTYFPRPELVD